MAIGFKGMSWILCGLVVAPGCYVVMSQVAAERARVESVERAIRQAQRDIRDLETEFRTRANFAQLEKWNGEVFSLAAPQPEQFAGDIAELAARGLGEGGPQMRYASYVVPTMTAEIDEAVQGGIQRAEAAARAAASQTAEVRTEASPTPAPATNAPAPPARAASTAAPASERRAEASPRPKAETTRTATASVEPARTRPAPRAEVATLDRKLLSDSTMGDLMTSARREAGRRN